MEQTLIRLQTDALARGMQELAIVYGWSLLRLKGEQIILAAKTPQFESAVKKLPRRPNGN